MLRKFQEERKQERIDRINKRIRDCETQLDFKQKLLAQIKTSCDNKKKWLIGIVITVVVLYVVCVGVLTFWVYDWNTMEPITAYIVEIEITKVNKHRHFPLTLYRKNGINYNDDKNLPITMTVDNITLEDLIKYQDIEFTIKRGYIWTGKKSFLIRDVIKKLFELNTSRPLE